MNFKITLTNILKYYNNKILQKIKECQLSILKGKIEKNKKREIMFQFISMRLNNVKVRSKTQDSKKLKKRDRLEISTS